MSNANVQPVFAAETRPLRHAILRPTQPPEACVYPGDDSAGAFHLGVRVPGSGTELVGVASFYRQPVPDTPGADPAALPGGPALRIRGMAVLPEQRGRGLGRALVDAGLAIAAGHQAPPVLVWCNARTSAAGYYTKLGFAASGDEFELPGIGPHRVMVRRLRAALG